MSTTDGFFDQQTRGMQSWKAGACICWRCLAERNEVAAFMVLCPTCGCKRCPKASDHRLKCTGSNEPGQPGSVYGPTVLTPTHPGAA